MTESKIKKIINDSLQVLLEKDDGLIKKKVREEYINHKLACYFEQLLNKASHLCYDVDLEYNKNYRDPKKIIIDENNNVKAIRPDIIVHKRDTNTYNLIVFEIKKGYTNKYDLAKIKGLLKSPYSYKYGCLVSYLPNRNYILVKLLSKRTPEKIDTFKVYK